MRISLAEVVAAMTSTTKPNDGSPTDTITRLTEAQLAKFAAKFPNAVLEERIRRVNARDIPLEEKKRLVNSLIEWAHVKEKGAACCRPATGAESTAAVGEATPGQAPESFDDMTEALGVGKMLLKLLCDFASVDDPEHNPRRTLALLHHGLAKKSLPSIAATTALRLSRA